MQLQKTNGTAATRDSAQNAPVNKNQPVQTQAKSSAPSPAPSVPAMISAAGLPANKLSASIVSFIRFFSLPLKPELMAAIHRQSLPSSVPAESAAPAQGGETKPAAAENPAVMESAAKKREALFLAATAAESKGVELNPKGLAAYAEAIDPDHDRQNRRKHDQRDDHEEKRQKSAPVTASHLEEIAMESAEADPLLSVLNRLPGKNGRWIVLPFDFTEGGRDFRVSMRILLEQTLSGMPPAHCMAIDIAEDDRKWLFVLTPAANSELTVYLQPALPARKIEALSFEISKLMEVPPERVSVKNRAEAFPLEAGMRGQISIDEAV